MNRLMLKLKGLMKEMKVGSYRDTTNRPDDYEGVPLATLRDAEAKGWIKILAKKRGMTTWRKETEMSESFDEMCKTPGLKIRSGGRGRGLARGAGKGPIGVPWQEEGFDEMAGLAEAQSLRIKGLPYKVIAQWPPKGSLVDRKVLAAFMARGDAEAFRASKENAPIFKKEYVTLSVEE